MRKLLNLGAAALALALSATAVHAEGKLSIYHWFEYMPQELLDKFAKKHDIKVTMDTYDSNESMLATLKAGSIGSYDIAVPGDYMVKIMMDAGLLDEVKDGELKNAGNMEPKWVDVVVRSRTQAFNSLPVGFDWILRQSQSLQGRYQHNGDHLRSSRRPSWQNQRAG